MMKNPSPLNLVFCSAFLLLFSCTETPPSATNQLYEMLYDDALNSWVKEVEFVDRDLKLNFDCNRNLNQKIVPSNNDVWDYKTKGDTITNQLNPRQKVLCILDGKGRVKEYISLVDDGKEWYTYYKENWKLDEQGKLLEKKIESVTAKDKPYYVFKEVYQYDGDRKVDIYKYGKDEGSQTKNGLLRTETRLANENGHWVVIEELDEDGIPYRKSNLSYIYDDKGNWTECIIRDEDNYSGKSGIDTIQRKITYYPSNECR